MITSPAPEEGLADWTFSNAANYTVANVTLGPGGATLAWRTGSARDTTQADFAAAESRSNVDLAGTPGDVRILDTSQAGPPRTILFQPDPASMADNYLYEGNGGNPNFGTSADLRVGNWGGSEWNRAVLTFPALPLPSNATFASARLELYMHTADTVGPMDISVQRVVSSWTELGSNWDTRDGAVPWNTTGGDFDPTPVDLVAGITTTLGWYSWNITGLARAWWLGAIPNQGLMVRQADDTLNVNGRKQFYSSDATNATLRPRLWLTYTTPSSRGVLESGILDAGSTASWGTIVWNATVPAGTSVAVRMRSGNVSPIDGTWSPWSAPIVSGTVVPSPPARYLQYSLVLFTPNSTSPAVHDVTVGYGRFAPRGTAATEAFDPAGLRNWGAIAWSWTGPPGSAVTVDYSQDNGTSWAPLAPGADLTAALPSAIRLRLTLTTADTTGSPTVRSVSLGYRTAPASSTPLDAFPWWLLLVLLLAVAGGLVVAARLRTPPFRPTDLFLIHADGRLVARVGREADVPDELAVSGMFTVVAAFVKDAFRGTAGTGGELKSFEVDDREVSIAKGSFLFMALVSEGTLPADLSGRMLEFLSGLEAAYGPRLRAWDGLRSSVAGIEGDLLWFLRRGYRRGHPARAARYHP